jgi:integrase
MRTFKTAFDRAGLAATIRFHDLLHIAATTCAGGGGPKTVSERLGHSNFGITGDLYTDSGPQADRDAARTL